MRIASLLMVVVSLFGFISCSSDYALKREMIRESLGGRSQPVVSVKAVRQTANPVRPHQTNQVGCWQLRANAPIRLVNIAFVYDIAPTGIDQVSAICAQINGSVVDATATIEVLDEWSRRVTIPVDTIVAKGVSELVIKADFATLGSESRIEFSFLGAMSKATDLTSGVAIDVLPFTPVGAGKRFVVVSKSNR